MLFTDSEVNRIQRLLGYPSNDPLFESVKTQLAVIVDSDRKTEIINLADQLDAIDLKISEFTLKNFVRDVGEISLDYPTLLKSLVKDGDRKLKTLANLCQLDIKFNKFRGSTGDEPSHWSIRSLS